MSNIIITSTQDIAITPPPVEPPSLPRVDRETFREFLASGRSPSEAESKLVRENPILLMLIQTCQQNVTNVIKAAARGSETPLLGADGNPIVPKKTLGLPREVAHNLCAELVMATYCLIDDQLRKDHARALQGRPS